MEREAVTLLDACFRLDPTCLLTYLHSTVLLCNCFVSEEARPCEALAGTHYFETVTALLIRNL